MAGNGDMMAMSIMPLLRIAAVAVALATPIAAQAQIYTPPSGPLINPVPPPPPPPPKIEVPPVPKMDAPPQSVRPAGRNNFGKRIIDCLDDAAAAGLGPTERAAYSRACANQ